MSHKTKVEKFFITAKEETTLLNLLDVNLPDRYNAADVIASGGVWLDRIRITNPSYKVAPQITVRVHTSGFQGKKYTLDRLHIIFENEDLIVVYKPRNLNVHAVPSSQYYHLMYGVNQYFVQQGIEFEANPVTRLDRPVEGLVIFPKNKNYERKLFDLIKRRKIKKWYMAALEKREPPTAKYLRFTDTITNDGDHTYHDEDGKIADSLFVKVGSLAQADIYSVYIFTGRRHQIRFHAAHYLAPIIGDRFYGSATALPPDEIALICRGYNIPYKKGTLRIRLPQHFLDDFYAKLPAPHND